MRLPVVEQAKRITGSGLDLNAPYVKQDRSERWREGRLNVTRGRLVYTPAL